MSRSYLNAIDGYWADTVLEEFAFLEELGGTLEEVSFHQKGSAVRYAGPWGTVLVEFEPDSDWIGGGVWLQGQHGVVRATLDQLAHEQLPGREAPPTLPLDREHVAAIIRYWAEALRASPDLLSAQGDGSA